MSSRLYPIYQRGNPQLRIFLPNFWLKLVKYELTDAPPNRVKFMCHNGMSRIDVKNYLEKVYNVPAVSVKIHIQAGEVHPAKGKQYLVKDDDVKIAYVTLPKGYKFEFPDIFPKDKKQKDIEDEQKQLQQLTQQREQFLQKAKKNVGLPGWFQ